MYTQRSHEYEGRLTSKSALNSIKYILVILVMNTYWQLHTELHAAHSIQFKKPLLFLPVVSEELLSPASPPSHMHSLTYYSPILHRSTLQQPIPEHSFKPHLPTPPPSKPPSSPHPHPYRNPNQTVSPRPSYSSTLPGGNAHTGRPVGGRIRRPLCVCVFGGGGGSELSCGRIVVSGSRLTRRLLGTLF